MSDPIMNVTVQLAPGTPAPAVDPQMQHLFTVAANAALHALHRYLPDAIRKHAVTLNIGPIHDDLVSGIDKETPSLAGAIGYGVVTALKADLKASNKTLP